MHNPSSGGTDVQAGDQLARTSASPSTASGPPDAPPSDPPPSDPPPSGPPPADQAADRSTAGAGLVETTLVARAQQGDPAAFEQLVLHYSDPILRLCVRMLGDRAEAEDAVQDSFVLVWRRLPTLRDPQAFHAWIYHLATRQCLNVLRARSRRPATAVETETLDAVGASPEPGPAAETQTSAQWRALDRALRELPMDQRACWVLRELHELSYPEIAYALEIPVSTVRGRLARARRELAKGMAAWR